MSSPFLERQREREEGERRRREAFSSAMEERRLQRQREAAQGSLNAANDITVAPDVVQAARDKGIPLDIAAQTQDEIRRLEQEERGRNALQRSPALSRTLEDPNRAVTLGPSAEQLADVDEQAVRPLVESHVQRRRREREPLMVRLQDAEDMRQPMRPGRKAARYARSGAGAVAGAYTTGGRSFYLPLDFAGEFIEFGGRMAERGLGYIGIDLPTNEELGLNSSLTISDALKTPGRLYVQEAEVKRQQIADFMPKDQTFDEKVFGAATQYGTQILMMALNPQSALAQATAFAAGEAAENIEEAGFEVGEQPLAFTWATATQTLIEKVRIDSLLRYVPKEARQELSKGLFARFGRVLGQTVEETAAETAGELSQQIARKFFYDADYEIFQGLDETASVTAASTVIMSSLLELAIPGKARVDLTNAAADALRKAREAVQALEVTEKHEADVTAFLDNATEDQEVEIDGIGFSDVFQDDPETAREMMALLGVSDAEIERALDGGAISVKASKLLTAKDNDMFEAILDITRIDPEGKTLREVREEQRDGLGPELQEEFDRTLNDVQALEAYEAVEQDLLNQLIAAGQDPVLAKQQARMWYYFARSLESLDVDVADVMGRLGLRVLGPEQEMPTTQPAAEAAPTVPPEAQPEAVAPTVAPETTAKSQSLLDAFLDSATFNPLLDEAAATASPEELRIIHRQLFGREARGETAQEIADEISRRRIREVDVLDRDDEGRAELAARTLFDVTEARPAARPPVEPIAEEPAPAPEARAPTPEQEQDLQAVNQIKGFFEYVPPNVVEEVRSGKFGSTRTAHTVMRQARELRGERLNNPTNPIDELLARWTYEPSFQSPKPDDPQRFEKADLLEQFIEALNTYDPTTQISEPSALPTAQQFLDAFLDSATFNQLADQLAASGSLDTARSIYRQLFGRAPQGTTTASIADEIGRQRRREVDVLDRDDEGRAKLAARTLFTDVEGTELEQAKRVGYEGQDTGEAAEWIRARDKGLDMSPEARMQRARDMGFDTETILYHGSREGLITEFRPSTEGAMGPGVYMTDTPKQTKMYAGRKGTVYPLYVRGAIIDDAELDAILNEPSMVREFAARVEAKSEAEGYQVGTYEDVKNEMAQELGYAGRSSTSPQGKTVVIFDPVNIRSVNAAFDPDYADEPTLLAQAKRTGYEGENTSEAAEWVRARDKGLDMSDEARMQRAEDIGFDTSKVLYHGTDATFDAFQRSERGKLGAGVYLSPKTTKARQFGDIIVKTYVRGNFAPQSLRNEYADRILASIPMEERKAVPPKEFYDRLKDQTNEALAADGYDGIDAGDELLVFNPANIRSVRAAFDPDYVDDPTLLAQDQELEAPGERGPEGLTRVPGALGTGAVLGTSPTFVKIINAKNKTTFMHESAHVFLEIYAALEDTNDAVAERMKPLREWLGWQKGQPLTRAMHEKFAGLQGFEAYLTSGKAPVPEMIAMFEQFRGWFLDTYRRLRNQEIKIDDNAREFFDRMLVTEESVGAAEQQYHDSMIETMRGLMTPEQVAKHKRFAEKAARLARDRIFKKHLERIARRDRKSYKDLEKKVRAEVEALVAGDPIVKAMEMLTRDENKVLLDADSVRDVVGDKDALAALEPYMTTEGGMDVDTFADLSGFADVDQMLVELQGDFDMERLIDAEVQRRMQALPDDLLVDEERAMLEAIEATFNDPQVRKLEVERDVLAQRALKEPIPLQAIRARAKRLIEETPINDIIKPGRYAMQAQNLHKRAVKMAAMGRFDEALRLTHKAMLQHEMARMAYKARAETEKINRFLARFARNRSLDPKKIQPAFIEMIRLVMAMPASGDQTSARARLLEFEDRLISGFKYTIIDENGEAQEVDTGPIEVVIPAMVYNGQDLPERRTMTLQELRDFRDSVKSIYKAGRDQSDMTRRQAFARNKEAADIIYDTWGGRKRTPEDYNKTKVREAADRLKQGVDNGMLRLPFFAQMLNGGDRRGPIVDRLYNKIAEAFNRKERRATQLIDKLGEIFKAYKITGRDLSRTFDIPELFTVPGTRENLFVMLLNMGNEGNLQRLKDNPMWGRAARHNGVQSIQGDADAILAILETHLEPRHFQAAQEIWNLLETQRDALGEVQRKKTGVMPQWVEPAPLITRYGTFKGGYYPISYGNFVINSKVNNNSLEDAFKAVAKGQSLKAQTRSGMAQARAEKVTAAISLDLNYIMTHINDVSARIEMTEAIDDAWNLATSPVYERAVKETFGEAYIGEGGMTQTILRFAAVDAMAHETADGVMNGVLRNVRIAFAGNIFGTFKTALAAPASWFETVIPEYGWNVAARGWMEWFGRGIAGVFRQGETMEQKSPFMAERKRLLNREAHDVAKRKVFAGTWSKAQAMAFVPMVVIEKYSVSGPLWWGVYTTSLEQGLTEQEAIQEADKAIANTQGSGRILDQSVLQLNTNELIKMITVGAGFASGVYGLQRQKLGQSPKVMSKLMFLLVYYGIYKVASATMETLIREGMAAFEDDDEDEYAYDREGLYLGDLYLNKVMKLYARNVNVVPLVDLVLGQYDTTTAASDIGKKGRRAYSAWFDVFEQPESYGFDDENEVLDAVAKTAEVGALAFGVPFYLQAKNSLEAAQEIMEEGEDVYTFENLYKILVTGPTK